MSGRIIRATKDEMGGWFKVRNEPFNDDRLSWEARGVLGYLLSKPDNWLIRMYDLENKGNAGRDRIARIIKELETLGYVTRKKFQNEDGTFEWDTTIYEYPSIPVLPVDGSAVNGSSVNGSSEDGKHVDILNTELKRTELINTDLGSTEEGEKTPPSPLDGDLILLTFWEEITGMPTIPGDKEKRTEIIELLQTFKARHSDKTVEYLKPFYDEWIKRGYSTTNLAWLHEWAVSGVVPEKKNGKAAKQEEYQWKDEEATLAALWWPGKREENKKDDLLDKKSNTEKPDQSEQKEPPKIEPAPPAEPKIYDDPILEIYETVTGNDGFPTIRRNELINMLTKVFDEENRDIQKTIKRCKPEFSMWKERGRNPAMTGWIELVLNSGPQQSAENQNPPINKEKPSGRKLNTHSGELIDYLQSMPTTSN